MKISVIMPCYNEELYIGQAIGSVIEKTRPADEIIVVDDGSDDQSTEIAKSFGDIVTVLSTSGGGAPEARNLGAEYATGDALMFFDSDDVLGPYVLEALAELLEKYPDGIAACQWLRMEKVDGFWVKRPQSCPPLHEEKDYLSGWMRGIYQPTCSVLWSRIAYEKTAGWDPQVTVNQDGDLMMRALADGIELNITMKGVAYYRRMPSHELSASQIFVLKKIITKLEETGRIDNYRHPLTETLNNLRTLCKKPYPELADECSTLIKKYGEPGYVQTARKSIGFFRYTLRDVSTRIARSLDFLGLHRTRQFLAKKKNMLSGKKIVQNQISKDETEIRYGLKAYQKEAEKRKSI